MGRKYIFVLTLIFIVQHLLSKNAFAYLDPGTGSYIFQIFIATIVAGLFAIKMFWRKIKGFFLNYLFKKK